MPTPDDTRRRVRAAQAMGGYASVEDLASALAKRDSGIGLRRLRTIWQKGVSNAAERREIADACGVPYWFLEDGFKGPEVPAQLEDRVEALEEFHHTTAEALEVILERLGRLAPDDPGAD